MTKIEYAAVPHRFDEIMRRVECGATFLLMKDGRPGWRLGPVDPAEAEANLRRRRLIRKVSRIR